MRLVQYGASRCALCKMCIYIYMYIYIYIIRILIMGWMTCFTINPTIPEADLQGLATVMGCSADELPVRVVAQG